MDKISAGLTISILIPCHNEEKTIAKCVNSCLAQLRPANQIIVIDDGSTDNSVKILEEYGGKILLIKLEKNTGNKSYVQQFGLTYVSGDVLVSTDADTVLSNDFLERMEIDFSDEKVVAVAGYVKSVKYNWLTAIRELDYLIGQEIHKTAQSNINFLLVIPGCSGAFRTDVFREHVTFDHDTLTEDLDFTYKINEQNYRIVYDKKAIVFTQDPSDLKSYVNQMRRWYGGGWQNLLKHLSIVNRPASAMELSLLYFEGIVFSSLMFLIPLANIFFFFYYLAFYAVLILPFGIWGAISRKRADLLYYAPLFPLVSYLNAYIFLEQFAKIIILRKKSSVWFSPVRR
jgi:cellulose synthase/poly-beta-1,6-N-acetylglucosamine synthase-like glycosyltransferase